MPKAQDADHASLDTLAACGGEAAYCTCWTTRIHRALFGRRIILAGVAPDGALMYSTLSGANPVAPSAIFVAAVSFTFAYLGCSTGSVLAFLAFWGVWEIFLVAFLFADKQACEKHSKNEIVYYPESRVAIIAASVAGWIAATIIFCS